MPLLICGSLLTDGVTPFIDTINFLSAKSNFFSTSGVNFTESLYVVFVLLTSTTGWSFPSVFSVDQYVSDVSKYEPDISKLIFSIFVVLGSTI